MTKDVNYKTNEQRKKLTDILFAEKCSCVICNGKDVRIFRERGVKDLFRLLNEEPEFLKGAFVADKVVGKGAAALMILGGVKEVFADVISLSASDLFADNGVQIEYSQLVPHIINRTQTDCCPLEKRCADCRTAEACLPVIEDFIKSISQ